MNKRLPFPFVVYTLLIIGAVFVVRAFAVSIFEDDFELGNTSKWTSSLVEAGNTLEVIPSAAQQGRYGLHILTGGANDDALLRKSITATPEIYTRVMMRLVANVATGNHYGFQSAASAADGANVGGLSIRRTSGDPANSLYTYAVGSNVDTTFDFALNTWYCVETHVVRDATAGRMRVWVDGNLKADRTGLSTGTSNISYLRLGADGANLTSEYYFDDFKSDNAAQIGCGAVTPSPTPSPTPTPTPTPTPITTPTPTPTPSITQAVITRYPYMQSCMSNSIIVAWQTDVAGIGTVEYGLTPSYGSSTSDGVSSTLHAVQLGGLLPGREYYYRVKHNSQVLTSEVFQTSKDETNPYFSFTAFGDSGEGSPEQQEVGLLINPAFLADALMPDLMIHTGDVIYPTGEARYYDPRFFSMYKQTLKRVCMFPSLGNHDIRTLSGQPYYDAFYLPVNSVTGTEQYYSFDYANAHFIAVDSNIDSDSSVYESPAAFAMKEWIRQDLAATTKRWKFVYFHHPPYSLGTNHPSDMRMRSELSPIFEQYNVDVVYTGHDHNYQRSTPRKDYVSTSNGVVYIVTGGGGCCLYALGASDFTAFSASKFHLALTSIYDDRYVLHAIDKDKNIIDTHTINKGLSDLTAPVVSGVTVHSITSNAATIGWNTDDLSNAKIEYGLTPDGLTAKNDLRKLTKYVNTHSIALTALERGQTYYYRVVSCNLDNNCSSTEVSTFVTLNPAITVLNAVNMGDTGVDSSRPTTDGGTMTGMQFGDDGTRKGAFFTKWNISSIPANAKVHKAILTLYANAEYMEAVDRWKVNFSHVYAYPDYSIAGQEWTEGNSNGGVCTGNELCWATRPTSASQMNLIALDSYTLAAFTAPVFMSFPVTNVLQEAIERGESNATIFVSAEKLVTDGGFDEVSFRTKEIGGTLVPVLTIEYY